MSATAHPFNRVWNSVNSWSLSFPLIHIHTRIKIHWYHVNDQIGRSHATSGLETTGVKGQWLQCLPKIHCDPSNQNLGEGGFTMTPQLFHIFFVSYSLKRRMTPKNWDDPSKIMFEGQAHRHIFSSSPWTWLESESKVHHVHWISQNHHHYLKRFGEVQQSVHVHSS